MPSQAPLTREEPRSLSPHAPLCGQGSNPEVQAQSNAPLASAGGRILWRSSGRQQLLAACGAPRAGCADLLSLLLPKGLVAAAGPPSYNESFIHLVVTWELTAKGGRSGRAVPYGSLCSGSREPAAGQPAIAMHNGCPSLPLSAWHRTVLFSL